jgi:hypothetical protein
MFLKDYADGAMLLSAKACLRRVLLCLRCLFAVSSLSLRGCGFDFLNFPAIQISFRLWSRIFHIASGANGGLTRKDEPIPIDRESMPVYIKTKPSKYRWQILEMTKKRRNSEDMLLQTKAWHHQGRFLETCHRPTDLGFQSLADFIQQIRQGGIEGRFGNGGPR